MPDDQVPAEQPTTEATQPDPAAEMAAKLAEAENRRAEAERRAQTAEEARLATERSAQERLADVARAVSELRSEQKEPATPEDEGEYLTRGQVKKLMSDFGRQFAEAAQNTITEETGASFGAVRATHRRLAERDPDLKYFAKYKDEIEAQIDKLPPKIAANPDVYNRVYQFVLTQHMNDVVAAEVEARMAAQRAEADDGYEPAAAPSRPEAPMPRGDGARGAISAPGRGRVPRLSQDEEWVVQQWFNGDKAAYLRERDEPTTGDAIFRQKR